MQCCFQSWVEISAAPVPKIRHLLEKKNNSAGNCRRWWRGKENLLTHVSWLQEDFRSQCQHPAESWLINWPRWTATKRKSDRDKWFRIRSERRPASPRGVRPRRRLTSPWRPQKAKSLWRVKVSAVVLLSKETGTTGTVTQTHKKNCWILNFLDSWS